MNESPGGMNVGPVGHCRIYGLATNNKRGVARPLTHRPQPVYDASPNAPAPPPVRSELLRDHPAHGWRVEVLSLSNHTGSHVDAPLHKVAGGGRPGDNPPRPLARPAPHPGLPRIRPGPPLPGAIL